MSITVSSGWCRKNPPTIQETPERQVPSLCCKDPQEEEMATHSNILAWRIPQKEETGGLQSKGSQTKNWTQVIMHTHTHTHTHRAELKSGRTVLIRREFWSPKSKKCWTVKTEIHCLHNSHVQFTMPLKVKYFYFIKNYFILHTWKVVVFFFLHIMLHRLYEYKVHNW